MLNGRTLTNNASVGSGTLGARSHNPLSAAVMHTAAVSTVLHGKTSGCGRGSKPQILACAATFLKNKSRWLHTTVVLQQRPHLPDPKAGREAP